MAWIKVEQSIKDHHKIYAVSDALGIATSLVIGMLVSLWLWALDNAPTGCLEGISARSIARAAAWDGDPDLLVQALLTARLIDVDANGRKYIHDWDDYGGKYIADREREKNRSKNRRNDKLSQCDRQSTDGRPAVNQKVSNSREEERTEKIIKDESRADGDETMSKLPVPYQEIFTLYSTICTGLPKVYKLTDKRKAAIMECWAAQGSLEQFGKLFSLAQASSFLGGVNERGWQADFDWLIQPDNMSKVLTGKYEDRRADHRSNTTLDVLAGIIMEADTHDKG